MIILLKGQLKRKLSTSKADGPAAKQHSIEKTGQYLYVINCGRVLTNRSLYESIPVSMGLDLANWVPNHLSLWASPFTILKLVI